jgi:hypothetical protein
MFFPLDGLHHCVTAVLALPDPHNMQATLVVLVLSIRDGHVTVGLLSEGEKPKLVTNTTTSVTEPTNYTRLSKKIIHRADDLTNLSPYNPVVREITMDFKPTYIPVKIVISSVVTITSYIKVRGTNTSEFNIVITNQFSNESSGSI